MAGELQFWFEFASTYSYVAAQRVEAAATRAGVAREWKPFLLGPIFAAQLGSADSPFNLNPIRGRYMWRDLERLCARYALPWQRPSQFPRASLLASPIACAAVGEPSADWLARAQAPEVKQLLRENTERAIALGMFGAPNFVVGDELFWG